MPECLGASGLGAHEHEHHLRLVRGAGPDLRAVDHEVAAVLARRRGEAREVAARARLRIALAPDHLAAQRRADPALLLLLAAVLEQRRHEHRGALCVRCPRDDARAVELLVHDHGREQVGLGAVAAVLLRDRARPVAVLDQQREPARALRAETSIRLWAGLESLCALEKRANFGAERFVLRAVFEVHRRCVLPAWADRPRRPRSTARSPSSAARRRRRPRADVSATLRTCVTVRQKSTAVPATAARLARLVPLPDRARRRHEPHVGRRARHLELAVHERPARTCCTPISAMWRSRSVCARSTRTRS